MAITKIGTPELFDFSATNTALQLPTGDTASRPSAPSAGEWRFNSEKKYVEYWDGGAWRQIDTEAVANPDTFPSENFNVNTYTGNGGTQTLDAKFNEAANFNGSSSQIEASGLTGTVLPTNGNWSVGFWMKPQATTTSAVVSLMTSSGTGWAVFTEANVVQVALNGSTPTASTGGFTTAALNTWMHVTLTFNSSTTVTSIYYNGGSSGANATINSGPSAATSATLKMGYSVWNYFQGQIDQVRLFNTTLSDAQVTDLYTNETTTTAATLNFPTGAGCIAAYQLDGDASDLSDNYPGAALNIGYTGLKFTPDFVWIKQRTSPIKDHMLYDTVRGPSTNLSILYSNLDYKQDNGSSIYLQSISTNAVNLGSSNYVNGSSLDYVAWCIKAGGAPTATNSAGAGNSPTPGSVMIDGVSSTAALAGTTAATKISANTKAGFSIVAYSGNSTAGATVAHGLTSPQMVMIKCISTAATNWIVYADPLGNSNYLTLNDALSQATYSNWFYSNATTFTLNQAFGNANFSGRDYVAYCFSNINGYQRISSYSGNSSEYGPIVYTTSDGTATGTDGFEPAFVMVKAINFGSNADWVIFDNKRSSGTGNKRRFYLYPNSNAAEANANTLEMNFYSNGFQPIGSDGTHNGNGTSYLYLAIATDPYTTTPTVTNSFGITLNDAPANNQPVASTFKPDQTWIKAYNVGSGNPTAWGQYDLLRGSGVTLQSDNTGAESDYYYHPTLGNLAMEFSDNGYITPPSVNNNINNTSDDFISYFWKLGGTQTINNDGTSTSVVTANAASGCSVAILNQPDTTARNFGHGLGGVPEMMILKRLESADDWYVYHKDMGNQARLSLDSTAPWVQTSTIWDSTTPTDQVFYLQNQTGGYHVCYFFRSIPGYQKVGSYTWNNTNYTAGTMVTGLGFTPRWVMIKAIDEDANWFIFDSTRGATTGTQQRYALYANTTSAQSTSGFQGIGFDSDGFSAIVGADGNTTGSGGLNKNGTDYIYLAIK